MKIEAYEVKVFDGMFGLIYYCSTFKNILMLTQYDPERCHPFQWFHCPDMLKSFDIQLEELIIVNQPDVTLDEYEIAEFDSVGGRIQKMTWHAISKSDVAMLKLPFCCTTCNTIIGIQPHECPVCGTRNKLL